MSGAGTEEAAQSALKRSQPLIAGEKRRGQARPLWMQVSRTDNTVHRRTQDKKNSATKDSGAFSES